MMSRNTQAEKQPMTPVQKQAILTCVVCALALLITVSVTSVLLSRGKSGGEAVSIPVSQVEERSDLADYYQIDTTSTAILTETEDAGEEYLSETLFLGDSNTVRYYNNGLISLQQFCAKEGIGIQSALSEPFVTFKNTDTLYTMIDSVAMMKPRRVVIMLGTNDNGMDTQTFINYYSQLVQGIQAAYPYTDIIVNTVPPLPQDHSNYPSMSQENIDDFNMALLSMCESLNVKFLNSAEALKDESTGYGKSEYYISGDIHLKNSGLKAILNYFTTHAYITEDQRPDTDNIPTRTIEYTSNPSAAVAPSSEVTSSATLYEARYQVEKNLGGTLSGSGESGKTVLLYDVTSSEDSITVTAVPDSGYVFVKWSDGVTNKTRTDTNFRQNLDVTAVFGTASIQISGEGSGILGMSYTFKAKLGGQYASSDQVHWYVNGVENTDAAGRTSVTFIVDPIMANETYSVYATVTYNGCEVTSNTLTVSFTGGVSSGSSSSESSSGQSSSSSSSSSGASSSSSSSSSTAASSSGASSSSSGISSSSSSQEVSASSVSSSISSSSSSSSASSSSSSGSSSISSSSSSVSSSSSGSSSSSSSSASSSSSSASASSSSSNSSSSTTSDDQLGDLLNEFWGGVLDTNASR